MDLLEPSELRHHMVQIRERFAGQFRVLVDVRVKEGGGFVRKLGKQVKMVRTAIT